MGTINIVTKDNATEYCNKINQRYSQHTLFDGNTNGSVTLSDRVDNYDFIEIIYGSDFGYSSKKFAKLGGWSSSNYMCLDAGFVSIESTYWYFHLNVSEYTTDGGTTLTRKFNPKSINLGRTSSSSTVILLGNDLAISSTDAHGTYIRKVIGYKLLEL